MFRTGKGAGQGQDERIAERVRLGFVVLGKRGTGRTREHLAPRGEFHMNFHTYLQLLGNDLCHGLINFEGWIL